MSDAFAQLLIDHRDEVAALDGLLSGLSEEGWLMPTPAEGWDTRDAAAHLAIGDEMALECVLLDRIPLEMQQGMDAVAQGEEAIRGYEGAHLQRGRTLAPNDVLAWWRGGNVALHDAFCDLDPSRRLPWGPNLMSPMSFVTARLMETWAHGLDCFDSARVEPVDTDRLRHVAVLALRALPYAYMVAGLPTPGPVRLELEGPSGDRWNLGPDDAPTVIRGSAGDWCRVAVHRDRRGERGRLVGEGPDAANVIQHAQAYL